jgi:DNA-binding winged helix-turn-helix (wHTH) protein
VHDRVRRLAFGDFVVDLATGELFRNGHRVPLQQQPFRVLRALVDRPGDLVTRDELRRLLWPADTFVAFERGLTSAMRKVREALGDQARDPMFIETLPGRGYRFIAPVIVVHPQLHSPLDVPLSPSRAHRLRRLLVRAAGVAGIALLSGTAFDVRTSAETRLAAAESLSKYACLLKSQGRFEDGLAAIRQAYALAPESARITAEVGFHLHAARQFDREFVMFHRAIALDDRSPDAWLHLGLGYARRSDFASAMPALARASALAHDADPYRRWLEWALSTSRTAVGD